MKPCGRDRNSGKYRSENNNRPRIIMKPLINVAPVFGWLLPMVDGELDVLIAGHASRNVVWFQDSLFTTQP